MGTVIPTEDITAEIEHIVYRFLPANREIERIGADDSFAELGLNSVSFLEIIVALEDRFEVPLTANPDELAGIDSLAAVRDLILDKVAAR